MLAKVSGMPLMSMGVLPFELPFSDKYELMCWNLQRSTYQDTWRDCGCQNPEAVKKVNDVPFSCDLSVGINRVPEWQLWLGCGQDVWPGFTGKY